LIHDILKPLLLLLGLLLFFIFFLELGFQLLLLLPQLDKLFVSFSPVDQAFSVQFFGPVNIVVLVPDTPGISFFDLSDTVIGHSFQGRLFLQFHPSHISGHLENLAFVLSECEGNVVLGKDIGLWCGSFIKAVFVVYQDVGHVEGFSEFDVIIVRLLLVFIVKGGAHGWKAVVVDDVLSDFSDVSFLLSKIQCYVASLELRSFGDDFHGDFMLVGNKLEERDAGRLLKPAGDEGAQKLAQFDGVFGLGLFTIYEMVQYNAPVRCLFLLASLLALK